VLAIFNPVYDAEQYGFSLAASPRQADVLLVSGPLTRNMEAALLAGFEAMPDQRKVITIGDYFAGKNMFGDSYAVIPLPEEIVAARVAHIPGDPPSPAQILEALRLVV
jgi:Ni,Fe-hydrogenase III small subunit